MMTSHHEIIFVKNSVSNGVDAKHCIKYG